MNRRHKPSPHRVKNPAYRQVFERLDEALAKNTQAANSERNRLVLLGMFPDLDELGKSGTVVIPK